MTRLISYQPGKRPACICGCNKPARPKSKYHSEQCRKRYWQRWQTKRRKGQTIRVKAEQLSLTLPVYSRRPEEGERCKCGKVLFWDFEKTTKQCMFCWNKQRRAGAEVKNVSCIHRGVVVA